MKLLRRTGLPLAATLVAVLAFALSAGAWWSNSGAGAASAGTSTMPGGNQPTVSAAGRTVTVNIPQVSVSGQYVGALGGSYIVRRYPGAGGAAVTPGGTCSSAVTGTAATLSCTETLTPRGDWKYTVSPRLYQWTSAESSFSSTVVVAPDPASGLSAAAAPAAAVSLSWTAGGGATGYNVYRRTSSGSYNFSAPANGGTPVNGTSWTDSGATSGTSYLYVVRSVVIGSSGQQIESASSPESGAVTADGTAPTGVTLSAVPTPTGGTLALTAAASDTISGVANVAFQYKPSTGSAWSSACTDGGSPYDCTFDTTSIADGLYDFRALASDNAGNQTASVVQTSRRIDNTAPTASATDPGTWVRGTVTLGGSASDAGSGIASIVLQGRAVGGGWGNLCSSATSPLVCPYDTTGLPDGAYEVQLIATDNFGNVTTTPAVTPINVDNTAPTVTVNDPGAYLSGSATLASTAADAGGIASVQYQYKLSSGTTWSTACAGSTTPFSCAFNTAVLADGLYDFRATATDLAGNQTTSASVTGRRIDNTAPGASTLTNPGTPLRGAITLNASTPTDAGSGVASVAIQRSPNGAGSWTTICTDTTPAYSCSFDTSTTADGSYDFRTFTTDNAGNTAAGATIAARILDNTAPSVTLTDPGSPRRATIALAATATDAGSGMASVAFQYKLSSGTTWTTIATDTAAPWGASWAAAALNGTYDLRALATDNAGNQSTSTITGIVVDNIAPTAQDIQTANGSGTARRPDAGDTITYTFSEAMLPDSILSGWTGASTAVTVRLTQAATDTITVFNGATQLPLGSVTIRTGYVTSTANFNSTMVMTGNTIVLTLGTQTSGTVATYNTNVRMVWTPSTAATDLAGNPMSAATRTESGGNDREF